MCIVDDRNEVYVRDVIHAHLEEFHEIKAEIRLYMRNVYWLVFYYLVLLSGAMVLIKTWGGNQPFILFHPTEAAYNDVVELLLFTISIINSGVLFFLFFWVEEMDKLGIYAQWIANELTNLLKTDVLVWQAMGMLRRREHIQNLLGYKYLVSKPLTFLNTCFFVIFAAFPLGVSALILLITNPFSNHFYPVYYWAIGLFLNLSSAIYGFILLINIILESMETSRRD